MSTLTIIRQRRQRRKHEQHSASQRTRRAVFGLGSIVSAVLVVVVLTLALAYASLTRGLPPVEELTALLDPQSGSLLQPTTFYDRTGEHLLASLSPNGSANPRAYIPYDQFPQALVDATVAATQPDFWTSPGYLIEGWRDADLHPTLAQELVSELLLWDMPASPLRAIQERLLAAQVTARYGREQVLEWYLNSADYGHYAYGAEAAAQFYFGKSVTDLTLSEATLLAATAQAPALNPLDAPQAAEDRRLAIIETMLGQEWITPEETSQAILNPPSPRASLPQAATGDLAPAFVTLTLSQLDAALGAGRADRGGMVVTTSLDYTLQLQTLCAVQSYLDRLAGTTTEIPAADGSVCESASLLPALSGGVTLTGATASALILDPTSGQVLAAVGDLTGGVQADTLSAHPAGTSVTPFLYLTGFSRGLNPASLGWDLPSGTPDLGQVYHGPVRLRTALVNDYLPPAVTVLEQMGVDSVQSIAAPLGLELPATLLTTDFNISPLSLAQAYGIFATGGTLVGQPTADSTLEPVAVLRVTGVDHSLWLDWTTPEQQSILSPQLAYLMNQVLSDETARWPSLGHPNALEIGRPAGAKLSRTLDLSAGWTVGYTPQRVTVVYLGAQTGTTDPALSANLWNALTRYAARDLPTDGWDMPSGLVTVTVCDPSGLLPTADCPSVVSELFLDGRQPVQADTLYRSFQVNVETNLLATVFSPPELVEERVYMVLPAGARPWAEAAGIALPPSEYDIYQQPAASSGVQISAPTMFSDGRGQVNILGTAAGADFVSYRLEYGQGLYPQSWVQIGEDVTTPVTDGLLATWDTTGLDGLYALRLMVVRSDQRVDEALVQVTLDNTPPQAAISYPAPSAVLTRADEPQVALQAQVNDPFLMGVAFYLDGTLLDTLEAAPFGVVWEAAPGDHTLKVVATDRAGNTAETSIVFTVK